MTDRNHIEDAAGPQDKAIASPRRSGRALAIAAALVAACAAGAGATALAQRGRAVTYVALAPSPIAAMQERSQVALEGAVAETFGNKFVVEDGSGRALVETGRAGEGRDLVAKGEKLVVQGRFDHGFVHAISIRHADGRTDGLAPPPPPRRETFAGEPDPK